MKFRISVSDEKQSLVEKFLAEHGIEIGEDAEYVISESSGYASFLAARGKDREAVRISADEVVFIDGGKIVLSGNKDEILEKHAVVKCKKDELSKVSETLIVNSEVSDYGAEILVNDRHAAEKLYPGMVIERAELEQIMIGYVNGKK